MRIQFSEQLSPVSDEQNNANTHLYIFRITGVPYRNRIGCKSHSTFNSSKEGPGNIWGVNAKNQILLGT